MDYILYAPDCIRHVMRKGRLLIATESAAEVQNGLATANAQLWPYQQQLQLQARSCNNLQLQVRSYTIQQGLQNASGALEQYL